MAALRAALRVSVRRFPPLTLPTTTIRQLNIPTFRWMSEDAKPKVNPEAETKTGTETTEIEKQLKVEIENLAKDLEAHKEKYDDMVDKYKRSLADGENLRRRMTKQIEDAKIFSIQSFCKDLLDVADILSKATDSVPKEQICEANPHLKSLFDGLRLTEAQLHQVFKRHGLEAVNPLNNKFDPNLHEALFVQEVNGAEPGTVVVVSKIGYKLQDRCVRPALVGVAKG